MINIIVGKPGTGKTYSLVRRALYFIKRGRNVYSNFYMDFSRYYPNGKEPISWGHVYYWKNVRDLMAIKSGEIFIDEAQIYLNSRDWKSLPSELMYKLQQHRKQGLNIWGAVQNVKRIDTVCRELVNSIFELRRVSYLFVQQEFDIEDIDKTKRHCYSRKFFLFDKKLASCYDTLYEISQAERFPKL